MPLRLSLFAFVCLLLTSFLNAQTTQPASSDISKAKGLAVVEIFTSEGCSSCPPSEKYVAQLDKLGHEKGIHLYTLAWHVDYWDYIGWKDIYAHKSHTKLQRRYTDLTPRKGRLWTPHVLVNGDTQFSGKGIGDAISKAMNAKPTHEITLAASKDDKQITLTYEVKGGIDGQLLRLVLAEDKLTSKITAGENKGRTLTHTAVVRDYQEIKLGNAKGNGELTIPANATPQNMSLLALVHDAKTLQITGATRIKVPRDTQAKVESAIKKELASLDIPTAIAPGKGGETCEDGVCIIKE